MIIAENIDIKGKAFVKRYSANGFYIERDSAKYAEAIDPADIAHIYTETDEPIDSGEEQTEIEQKSDAFDYLTGRSATNE